MRKWKHTLNLSNYWHTQEWTNENVHELGKIVASKLKSMFPYHEHDFELDEIIYHIGHICTQDDAEVLNYTLCVREAEWIPLEEFDEWMTALYDWCDENDVWVKLD